MKTEQILTLLTDNSLNLTTLLNTPKGMSELEADKLISAGLKRTSLWLSFTSGTEHFNHELDKVDEIEEPLDPCSRLFNELRGRELTEQDLKSLAAFYDGYVEMESFWFEPAMSGDVSWKDIISSEDFIEVRIGETLIGPDGKSMEALNFEDVSFSNVGKSDPSTATMPGGTPSESRDSRPSSAAKVLGTIPLDQLQQRLDREGSNAVGGPSRFAPSAAATIRFRVDFSVVLSGRDISAFISVLDEYVGTPSFSWSTEFECVVAESSGGSGFSCIGLRYFI